MLCIHGEEIRMIFSDAASAVGWADAVANSADVRGVLAKLLSSPGTGNAKDLALTITGKVRGCTPPACELYLVVYGEHSMGMLMDMASLISGRIETKLEFSNRRLLGLTMIILVGEREKAKFGRIIPRSRVAKLAGVSKEEFRTQKWADAESEIRSLINGWLESADRQITLELEAVGVL